MSEMSFEELYRIIESKREAPLEGSYTARLFRRGRGRIAQKIGEEATELVIEAIRDDRALMIEESADVVYHLVALWVEAGISVAEVVAALERRRNISSQPDVPPSKQDSVTD